ncbi:MAG: hypothetical protein IJB59_02450 [Oscillospiraceae bacterium]|nr:hypothetical protein [Oscillospiraceae bacterium]
MKRRILFAVLLVMTLLLTGCTLRTVEEMYALPKRSSEYSQLQSAIDTAMYGLTYSSPQSGENQQTIQLADLDGDGTEEYLVFAKGATEKPLQVLIFTQEEDGSIRTMETIGLTGTSFEQVEYVDFDDRPGCELILGFQVSDQVQRSVAVYSFPNGDAQLLLLNGYSKFLPCDLDENRRSELMVLRPGEAETERCVAVLYSWDGNQIRRSVETELSQSAADIRRITSGSLQDGTPAVYVASTDDSNAIVTDILAMSEGKFSNITVDTETETSIHTLRNFYIYAEDIDNDGIQELPSLITMKPVSLWQEEEQKFLLRWFAIDVEGWETDKLFTFHNYVGGWYIQLDSSWAGRATVDQGNNVYSFYVWDESYKEATALFTIYVFTGSSRDEAALQDGRFALHRAEGVAYAAKLEYAAAEYGITEEYLTECFRLIRQDWQTGET